jgi:crossover junction endodeoxyribonuclease RusA
VEAAQVRRLILFPVSWPDKNLSSNARVHWAKKAKATKAAREEAYWSAKSKGIDNLTRAERYDVLVEFYPPDRRKRDAHNFPAMVKGHLDGLADALGCDDNAFNVTWKAHAFDGKGGVLISVQGAE